AGAASGAAGATGSGGTGAAGSPGTGPCAGLCSNPMAVAPNANSGGLGTGATCNDVIGNVTHLVCGNFVAPRTFSVNGKALDCATGGTFTLPAPVNGGFCMQAGAGNYSYAYFTTY
ncbi:MAG TPA: peptidase, partial [Polyangia bacterium]|nr:peptidase [Polyangia bacterium]